MKILSKIIVTLVINTGYLLSSCNNDFVNVKSEFYATNLEKEGLINPKDEIATANKGRNSDFEKFIVKTKAIIHHNELKISELNMQVVGKRFETTGEILLAVDGIDKRNNALKEKLDNYVANGSGNWKIFESAFNCDLNKLSVAFVDADENIKILNIH